MSSSRSRGGHSLPAFSSTTPHFFAVILEETLEKNELPIPRKFVKKYGETLSNPVLFKLPCGSEWKMELTKNDDGRVCFQKNWPEFSEHYSIDVGRFLVFQYVGNSKFHVVILDQTCTEIDYPPRIPAHLEPSTDGEQLKLKREEVEDDDSLEILDDRSLCPKIREKPPLPCSRPRKIGKASPSKVQSSLLLHEHKCNRCNEILIGNSRSKGILESSTSEMEGKQYLPSTGDIDQSTVLTKRKYEVIGHRKRRISSETFETLQKARDFNSENPFFLVVMSPNHLKDRLTLPKHFRSRYLNEKLDNVIFKVSGERRIWHCRCTVKGTGIRLRSGWINFARDNHLKLGDICVFVLHKGIEVLFEIFIFRVSESSKLPMSPVAADASTHESRPVRLKVGGNLTNEVEIGDTITGQVRVKVEGNLANEDEIGGTITKKSGWTSNEETGIFPLKSKRSQKPTSSRDKRASNRRSKAAALDVVKQEFL